MLHIPLFKPDPDSGTGPYYYTLMNLSKYLMNPFVAKIDQFDNFSEPFTEYKITVTAVTRKYDGEQTGTLKHFAEFAAMKSIKLYICLL